MKNNAGGTGSGIETLKTLAGAVGVATFTVRSLAERTGVSDRTVDTVVRRYGHAFERLGPASRAGRGRPEVTWRLRSTAIDEIASEVAALGRTIDAPIGTHPSPSSDMMEASLTMAQDAVLTADPSDPDSTADLIAAARASLAAAGLTQVPDRTKERFIFDAPVMQAKRALLIDAVADLIAAQVSGKADQVDAKQADAFLLLLETQGELPAGQWNPLAQRVVAAPGTILSSPVATINSDTEHVLTRLFPKLTSPPEIGSACAAVGNLGPPFAVFSDPRLPHGGFGRCVFVFDLPNGLDPGAHETLGKTLQGATATTSPNTSPKPVVMVDQLDSALVRTIDSYGAGLVVLGGPRETSQLARVINRLSMGLDV